MFSFTLTLLWHSQHFWHQIIDFPHQTILTLTSPQAKGSVPQEWTFQGLPGKGFSKWKFWKGSLCWVWEREQGWMRKEKPERSWPRIFCVRREEMTTDSFVRKSWQTFSVKDQEAKSRILYRCLGLPQWLKNLPAMQETQRLGFNPWVRKMPWRRAWQPTRVFLPGESCGWRSLADSSLWDCKTEMTEQINNNNNVSIYIAREGRVP